MPALRWVPAWARSLTSWTLIHQGPDWRSQTWKDSVHEGYASQALDPLQDTPILIGSLEGDAPLIGAAEHLLASLK